MLGHRPRELSNGQKQRTSLARALVRGPGVLLLDDPLRNVDAKLRYEMRLELPRLLASFGSAVIYVTQDYREAMALGRRIAVLRGGRFEQVAARRRDLRRARQRRDRAPVRRSDDQPLPLPRRRHGAVELFGERVPLAGGIGRRSPGARSWSASGPRTSRSRLEPVPGAVPAELDAVTPLNVRAVLYLRSRDGEELLATVAEDDALRFGRGHRAGLGAAAARALPRRSIRRRRPALPAAAEETAMAASPSTGVSKVYRTRGKAPVLAVDKVDLAADDGEIVGLLGSSGCGKTSTLRMIAGFEDVTSGAIRVGDRPIHGLLPKDRGVAMAFEGYALYPPLTIRDNIGFALLRERRPRDGGRRRVSRRSPALLEIERHPRPLPAHDLGRPAAAHQPRPRPDPPRRRLAARRAHVAARAAAARDPARPDQGLSDRAQDDDGVRHPRPDRGDRPGRPDRGHGAGRAAAVRARRRRSRSSRPTCSSRASSASRR